MGIGSKASRVRAALEALKKMMGGKSRLVRRKRAKLRG
ncbi:MAG: hypothetical protein ACJAY7_001906 [Pseudohongiellaceae bacterium]